MRQRVMIAMALACEPKLLIADEPTTALDVTIQAQILDLLRALVADAGMALILITHDLGVVAGMCERVNVMYARHVRRDRHRRPVFARPAPPVHARPAAERAAARRARARRSCTPIHGRAARHAHAAAACPFAPRCRYAVDAADEELPTLTEVEPGACVACFNPVPSRRVAVSRARRVA